MMKIGFKNIIAVALLGQFLGLAIGHYLIAPRFKKMISEAPEQELKK